MPAPPTPQLAVTWTNAAQQDLLLKFELAAPSTPEGLAELEGLVRNFAAVGAHGGFARETTSPPDSTLVCTQADLSDPTQPAFTLAARQVDVRAFQLMRHLAWRWSAAAQAVFRVVVTDQTSGPVARAVQLPEATWGTEEAAYPPLSQRVSIRVEREDPSDYRKSRRCVVEFARPVPADVFDSVLARIGAWAALLGRGAYGPPVKAPFEAEVWPENLGPYDEYAVELAFSLYEASESAWDVLLNTLQDYSAKVEPIVLVTIA
jgi:hypothetical protein